MHGLSENLDSEPTPPLQSTPPTLPILDACADDSMLHGKTEDGSIACCRKVSDDAVDCQACLDQAFSSFTASLDPKDQELAIFVVKSIAEAGPRGIAKEYFQVRHSNTVCVKSLDYLHT